MVKFCWCLSHRIPNFLEDKWQGIFAITTFLECVPSNPKKKSGNTTSIFRLWFNQYRNPCFVSGLIHQRLNTHLFAKFQSHWTPNMWHVSIKIMQTGSFAIVLVWSPTEFWKWKKGSTWASKQLRRAGAVFFHNSVLLIKMHTSKIGNTLYTEPVWKGACCS